MRNYLRKTERGMFTKDQMVSAVHSVLTEGSSLRKAAANYDVNYNTLERYVRLKKATGSMDGASFGYVKPRQILSPDIEIPLKDNDIQVSKFYHGITIEELTCQMAYNLQKRTWMQGKFKMFGGKSDLQEKTRQNISHQEPSQPSQTLKRILTSDPSSHVHSAPQPKVSKREAKRGSVADDPVCDFCELSSLSNVKGEPEMLLHCKDCTAKAHPSCMNYSKLLASRACRGPWQCMDCKTCCFCLDAGDPDQMLFCDGCDKGYHMNCHQPAIHKKPSGTWECSECRLENMALQRSEFMSSIGCRHAYSQESAPPTPAESPVPGNPVMNGDLHIPTKPVYLGNGKYPDASGWSVNDVVDYLTSAGFSEEAKVFKEQEIDGVALLLLKRADVLKGLELKLGPALKVNRHIQGLQTARQHLT